MRSHADEGELLLAAKEGDAAAFERLTANHRRELHVHCYRMLGSIHDAEDALQEALLGAWRGIAGFEGRSSLRAWLYRICTNACLRLIARRPRRMLSPDHGPPLHQTEDLGEPVPGPVWLEPWPDDIPIDDRSDDDPAAAHSRRKGVELAYVAALQHLPGSQRAVLILRDVLEYSAAEVATMLDTTPASVHSSLQRARRTVVDRIPPIDQHRELQALGAEGQKELVESFVSAWERADLAALVELLAEDARFTMPPLPAWFLGRRDVARFFEERVFSLAWHLQPIHANGQLAFACYQGARDDAVLTLGAINVVTLRDGRIAEIAGFLDPDVHRHFDLAPTWARGER